MAYVIGIVVALAVVAYATTLGFDRDRAFYPTVLIVTASYYVLFATMVGSSGPIVVESLIAGVFVVAAALGFRGSLWLITAGFAAHGVLDFFHARLVANPGVPIWWPAFCLAFDVAAAGYLTWSLTRASTRRAPVA